MLFLEFFLFKVCLDELVNFHEMFRLFKKVRLFLTVDDSVGIPPNLIKLSLILLNFCVIPVFIFCLVQEVGLSLNAFMIAQSWNVYTRSILHGFKSLLEALNLRVKLSKIISMLHEVFFCWFPLLSKLIEISRYFLDFLESELLKIYGICLVDSLYELNVFIQLGLIDFLLILSFLFNLVVHSFVILLLLQQLFLWAFGGFLLYLVLFLSLSKLGSLRGNINWLFRNLYNFLNLSDAFSHHLYLFLWCLLFILGSKCCGFVGLLLGLSVLFGFKVRLRNWSGSQWFVHDINILLLFFNFNSILKITIFILIIRLCHLILH